MAERLVFDLLANDRASEGFKAAGRAASAAADDVKGLQHRLDEISAKSAKARVGLEGNKEALAQLDKLDVKLLTVGKRRANPNIKLEGALRANLELAGLDAELDKLNQKADRISGGGGGLAKLRTVLQGLAGMTLQGLAGSFTGAGAPGAGATAAESGAAGSPAAGLLAGAGGAALAPAGAGLLVEVTGLVSGLAAATAGVGAFGLLALPTFENVKKAYTAISAAQVTYNLAIAKEKVGPSKANAAAVAHALTGLRAAQENMAPSTRTAVTGIKGLVSEFDKMAVAFQPDVMKTFNAGLKIAHNLLPDLKPFADAAAGAIDGLLKSAGKFTQSSGFKTWLGQFSKLSGPAITAIGKGIGSLVISVGKLFTTMSAHDVVHSINIVFDTINAAIVSTTWALKRIMKSWDQYTTFFTVTLPAALRLFRDEALLVWDHVEIDVLKMLARVTGDFSILPGGLGAPFQKAHTLITGELAGIQAAAATTAARINADWATLHGHTVALNVKLMLPGGVSLGGRRLTGLAAGGRIPGYGGGDRHVIAVEDGETIVPKHLTPAVAPLMRAHGVPGFAAGGVVGPAFTGRFPSAATISADAIAMQAALGRLQAPLQLTQSAFTVPVPSGGGGPSANAALARRMFPAYGSGAEWQAWNYVAMRESGWNQFARNPGSGAYGIAQALPPTKYPFAGQAAGGSNPAAQIGWMMQYMLASYGGPIGAMLHERNYNWYDQGGWLPPGLSLAMNGTGRPEPVGAAAGRTYHITVSVPPGANMAEAGRVTVEAIREFEKRSGSSWRS